MRLSTYSLALASTLLASSALADTAMGPVATVPKVGDTLNQNGGATWPKMQWLYDAPSAKDAAGKIVIHWFCQPKVQACVDDLARVITLRDTGKGYIVAYLNTASASEAKKLDPLRESEGVGRGTVAYGKGVTAHDKEHRMTGQASFVVAVDGKVQLVSAARDP